jgi:hypothetical protein
MYLASSAIDGKPRIKWANEPVGNKLAFREI